MWCSPLKEEGGEPRWCRFRLDAIVPAAVPRTPARDEREEHLLRVAACMLRQRLQ